LFGWRHDSEVSDADSAAAEAGAGAGAGDKRGSGGQNKEEERGYSHSRIILKMASKSSLEEPEGNAITHFLLTYQHTSTN
jgi:hypothetical protein